MKGVILSGGTGSRLRPITHTGPKQLVPVANKPVLEYAIDDLVEADITYIVQGDPLGLAHAVGCARDFVGDDSFVVYLGDDMMREGIVDLVADFDPGTYAAGIGLQRVDEPSRYGIVDVDERGDISQLVEKPDDPPNNLALIGIYVFTPAIFDQIEGLTKSWRGEYEITEAIQGLLDEGERIQSHTVQGWWKDTGKPEDVLHANRLVLDDLDPTVDGDASEEASLTGRVELGEGSVVEGGAVVRGPVSIGDRTRIGSNAYIGPYTSVGDDCVIDEAHIESSVVIGDATITADRRIVDSLIGRNVDVTSKTGRKPDGEQLVVGQNSTLEL